MPLKPATIATNTGAGSATLPDPLASCGDNLGAVPTYQPPAPTIPAVITPAESLARNRQRGWEPAKAGPAGE